MAFVSPEFISQLKYFSEQLALQPALPFNHRGSTVISHFLHYSQGIEVEAINQALQEANQSWIDLITSFTPTSTTLPHRWVQNLFISGFQRKDLLHFSELNNEVVLKKMGIESKSISFSDTARRAVYLKIWIELLEEEWRISNATFAEENKLSGEDLQKQFERSKC